MPKIFINVMEIINDNLFVHAGVSPKLISTNLTLDRINQIARKYYAQPDEQQIIVHFWP